MELSAAPCDVGFIGLGVMGKNLTLNLADNGYRVAAFDLDPAKIAGVEAQDRAESGTVRVEGCPDIPAMLSRLSAPRLVVLSVPAGAPVDAVCEALLEAGIGPEDVVVDTGNSLWTDTVKREAHYRGRFHFFSTAVSGGEVGARFGPSLMPSGDPLAWARLAPLWQAIAAKVDPATGKPIERFEPGNPVTEGEPCAAYIGPAGAGHYVKMVHNGIEYADMQLICEAYHLLRSALGLSPAEIAAIFRRWNEGVLDSYLMDISAEVLETWDEQSDGPLVDVILDKAGQKGTGLWTAVSSLELGCPAPTIAQAVYARALSGQKSERVAAAEVLHGPESEPLTGEAADALIEQLHDALYCAKICAYAQGFQLMATAAQAQGWTLDFAAIARIWRAGCIIRAVFLHSIAEAYERDGNLANLLVDPFFTEQLHRYQGNWRRAVAQATLLGVPCGALSASLAYFDSYRLATLPANLLQGQRDFFGAHGFARIDAPESERFHVDWSAPARPVSRSQ
ncbi:NADP-dependent phosphogluconate dehydrogenase [Ferrimonas balearica]|uniref:NADP-dependent phosphogluconate dehydrogenase n=1 Tax=Ferrimonas balearica TaxID=44012 RepID=UPI001C998224|nr:NADP-dependent phosphogluconate dehydrogenase [Ferrimonas balearica]MBY5921620.1 NADP-dependent phosphogluconate dehydrogenase [Ferrimonas balearica]MBY5995040.1 NADP-dependent phosphogluconate dehydrogenase [Ferrimonas balearica]